jgi:signal transduction histidine kinase
MQENLFSRGELAARLRAFEWAQTPLGPPACWPSSLRSLVAMVLDNRFPMALWWGPQLPQIYNEAYVPVLGAKHPDAIGRPASEVWQEIWHILGPQAEHVLTGKGATWNEHLLLPMNRKGFLEETYFTFSYSPVRDDSGSIAGVLVTCQETTVQVQSERQQNMLRDLGARPTMASAEEACTTAATLLAHNDADIPFALLYLFDNKADEARLVATAGFAGYDGPGKPDRVHLREPSTTGWPLADVAADGLCVVDGLAARVGRMPSGRFALPPDRAVIVALTGPGQARPYGFLVAGVNPMRPLDERYEQLFRLTAAQIVIGIASARAYAEERARAEALAEIDRAKTTFFSNVSHEFRTPLTLMLGPIENALYDSGQTLAGPELQLVHRNAVRLLKLVNTLLDFSRIEAGRIEASYEPTDLASLTGELASVFRSAIENAGLAFVVDCPPLAEPVYVDREMWEKIVLNLLSNAFKFTFEGEIRVSLRELDEHVELCVADTGMGIPAEQLPRVFERFHRIKGIRARTHEGTGIGLALVQELVRLHGGCIEPASRLGQGTSFRVRIPLGHEHLPEDRILAARTLEPTVTGAQAYVEEALGWLPDPQGVSPELEPPEVLASHASPGPARILLADDNADMREYLRRLLGREWTIEGVTDGAAALASATAEPPDLVLTDVMMPGLDGFELLRHLRADPRTREIPVILLSARAGEEARVEALEAGADDYMIKPFSARELIARVGACLELTRVRKQAEQALRESDRRKDEFLAMLGHELRNPLAAIRNVTEFMRLVGSTDRRLQQVHGVLERQTSHMTRLIDSLLEVSRIARGKIRLDRQNLDLREVIEGVLQDRRPQAAARGLELASQLPPAPSWVLADAVRLTQVFDNLIGNAIKFTEAPGQILVTLSEQQGCALTRVRDTGVGIRPELLERLFEPFTQEEQDIARGTGGLGLGLTVAKGLVELHGGTIEAHSAGLGNGAEFVVRLPLSEAPSVHPSADRDRQTQTRRRVLVVEDHVDAGQTLRDLLELMNHEVRVATTAPEGLARLREQDADVVLCDLGLPGMSGFDFARMVRTDPKLRATPLIALTGYGQPEDRQRSLGAGFDEHLTKPVELGALESVLSRLAG